MWHMVILSFVYRDGYSYPWLLQDDTVRQIASTKRKTAAQVQNKHDDVIKWKRFPCYWPFVRGIHRPPHKGQWRGALMFSVDLCAWIKGWVNNGEAGDLRRLCVHYDVTLIKERWICCDYEIRVVLTNWDLDKMVTFLQTEFSSLLSWRKK